MRYPLIAGYITTGWLIPSRPAVPCEIDVNHSEAYFTGVSPAYYNRPLLRPNNKISPMLPLLTFPVGLFNYLAPSPIPLLSCPCYNFLRLLHGDSHYWANICAGTATSAVGNTHLSFPVFHGNSIAMADI